MSALSSEESDTMPKGVFAALSGAVAAQTSLDVTAQNLANASSPGYHKMRPVFREVLSNQAGTNKKQRDHQNHYAAVTSTVIDTAPGVIRSTGRAMDLALPEGAYLAVGTPRGERYTRCGAVEVDANGGLSVNNAPILDENGQNITVEAGKEVSFTADGQVLADGETQAQLKIVSFENPAALTPEAGALVAMSPQSGAATPAGGDITVGALEESNASAVGSMTDLITASRNFEAYQRAIDTFREADRKIVTLPSS